MTKEQAKELLPIIQAYARGKIIQRCINNKWIDIVNGTILDVEEKASKYRVKPECRYRAFVSEEECWNEMQRHQPFGWIEDKTAGIKFIITGIDRESIMYCDFEDCTQLALYKIAFSEYKFIDGKPFGIKEN